MCVQYIAYTSIWLCLSLSRSLATITTFPFSVRLNYTGSCNDKEEEARVCLRYPKHIAGCVHAGKTDQHNTRLHVFGALWHCGTKQWQTMLLPLLLLCCSHVAILALQGMGLHVGLQPSCLDACCGSLVACCKLQDPPSVLANPVHVSVYDTIVVRYTKVHMVHMVRYTKVH